MTLYYSSTALHYPLTALYNPLKDFHFPSIIPSAISMVTSWQTWTGLWGSRNYSPITSQVRRK
jgi:hypothetical protein